MWSLATALSILFGLLAGVCSIVYFVPHIVAHNSAAIYASGAQYVVTGAVIELVREVGAFAVTGFIALSLLCARGQARAACRLGALCCALMGMPRLMDASKPDPVFAPWFSVLEGLGLMGASMLFVCGSLVLSPAEEEESAPAPSDSRRRRMSPRVVKAPIRPVSGPRSVSSASSTSSKRSKVGSKLLEPTPMVMSPTDNIRPPTGPGAQPPREPRNRTDAPRLRGMDWADDEDSDDGGSSLSSFSHRSVSTASPILALPEEEVNMMDALPESLIAEDGTLDIKALLEKPEKTAEEKAMEDCFFFLRDKCKKGTHCEFRHNARAKRSDANCAEWLQTGRCDRGVKCHMRHATRNEVKPCYYFAKEQSCKNGQDCPFLHITGPILEELPLMHPLEAKKSRNRKAKPAKGAEAQPQAPKNAGAPPADDGWVVQKRGGRNKPKKQRKEPTDGNRAQRNGWRTVKE